MFIAKISIRDVRVVVNDVITAKNVVNVVSKVTTMQCAYNKVKTRL